MQPQNPTDSTTILRERARELARVPDEEQNGVRLDVIAFGLGAETYAIETSFVREVLNLRALTPVPGTPPFVAGIINVRGQIQTVIDLGHFLDLPPRPSPQTQRVIWLCGAGLCESDVEIGVLADTIAGARRLDPNDIQTALPAMLGAAGNYVRGVTDDALIVLEAARILEDERLIIDDAI